MRIQVQVSNEELAEMEVDAETLKGAVLDQLDKGVEANRENFELSGFNVDVVVVG